MSARHAFSYKSVWFQPRVTRPRTSSGELWRSRSLVILKVRISERSWILSRPPPRAAHCWFLAKPQDWILQGFSGSFWMSSGVSCTVGNLFSQTLIFRQRNLFLLESGQRLIESSWNAEEAWYYALNMFIVLCRNLLSYCFEVFFFFLTRLLCRIKSNHMFWTYTVFYWTVDPVAEVSSLQKAACHLFATQDSSFIPKPTCNQIHPPCIVCFFLSFAAASVVNILFLLHLSEGTVHSVRADTNLPCLSLYACSGATLKHSWPSE